MIKNLSILILFVLLSNCAAPGTALLSPVITGAKTKSAHQASLSLASSLSSKQLIKNHNNEFKKLKDTIFKKDKKIFKNPNKNKF
tara:strand:- start:430 stop:684 length:255 start_codon:yes stop_codon:yes gene_type:complete